MIKLKTDWNIWRHIYAILIMFLYFCKAAVSIVISYTNELNWSWIDCFLALCCHALRVICVCVQSAQLSQIVNSLMSPLSDLPSCCPVAKGDSRRWRGSRKRPFNRSELHSALSLCLSMFQIHPQLLYDVQSNACEDQLGFPEVGEVCFFHPCHVVKASLFSDSGSWFTFASTISWYWPKSISTIYLCQWLPQNPKA